MTAFVVWPLGPDRGGGAFLIVGVWDSLNRDWVAVQVGAATAWEKDLPGWILEVSAFGTPLTETGSPSRWERQQPGKKIYQAGS
ncbi:hypothetical protein QE152_g24372 [Popillia japonica]|uniref:Uncharacterized protein n=1 Tax=Popillia japonica TaxID=7064 RepID=A0AAW1KGC4_POPJA